MVNASDVRPSVRPGLSGAVSDLDRVGIRVSRSFSRPNQGRPLETLRRPYRLGRVSCPLVPWKRRWPCTTLPRPLWVDLGGGGECHPGVCRLPYMAPAGDGVWVSQPGPHRPTPRHWISDGDKLADPGVGLGGAWEARARPGWWTRSYPSSVRRDPLVSRPMR